MILIQGVQGRDALHADLRNCKRYEGGGIRKKWRNQVVQKRKKFGGHFILDIFRKKVIFQTFVFRIFAIIN